MPAIDQGIIQGFIDAGQAAATTADRGRALEDLICYLFGLLPGIQITKRNELNAFATEEIDVALWNDAGRDGLFFLPNIILVECKNWSQPVSSSEVAWFLTKLQNRGLEYGFLIAPKGITGEAGDLTAAHSLVFAAQLLKRRLILLTTDELQALAHTDDLVLLIKDKLCTLAVKGTI
jgi:hypothetical protein